MTPTLSDTLAFYSQHRFALFPCHADSKAPMLKWKEGSTTDPAMIAQWVTQGHNLAIDCAKSNIIVLDIDSSKVTRDEAWQAYTRLCASWSIPVAAPMTQSARGGWHVPVRRPADLAATDLRGGGTLVKISDVRPLSPGEKDGEVIGFKNRGYCIAAGSTFEGKPYLAMPNPSEPIPAPAALVELIKLPPAPPRPPSSGDWDHSEVLAILKHLHDIAHEYVTHGHQNRWKSTLAVRNTGIPFSDELYEYLGYEPGEEEKFYTRWEREDRGSDRNFNMQSLKQAAIKTGWNPHPRRSAQEMFGSVASAVAQIAQAAGASLPGIPMIGRGEKQTEYGAPILHEFLAATSDAPSRPSQSEIPQLPTGLSAHGLYGLLNESIERIFALSESSGFKPARVVEPLAILKNIHEDVFETVCRRLNAAGRSLLDAKIKNAANTFSDKVERAFVHLDDWKREGQRNEIAHDNPDNVKVFLDRLSMEVRWNNWRERMEIKGGVDVDLRWSDWTYVDDKVVARLRTRAGRTEMRFRPPKEFFWDALLSLSMCEENTVDPVLDLLRELERNWDGKQRLSRWLTDYCRVPDDAYHHAVARSIVGGMVMRARQPGVKFDTMPIFFGPQGTGKSTLISILALRPEFFTDSILLGEASKELVLSLAGKLVAEISEMGMRGNTNASHVKAMISRTTDAGRTAYARAVTERPRRNIWCGSTNDDKPLSDPSGNRRFLPVHVKEAIDLVGLRNNIAQIVGEAAALQSRGVDMSIPPEVYDIAAQHQEAARSVSDLEMRLTEWFGETEYTKHAYVLTSDLADLLDILNLRNAQMLRNTVMKDLGFVEARPILPQGRQRAWVRGGGDVTGAVRYIVSKTADGRPRVTITSQAPLPPPPR